MTLRTTLTHSSCEALAVFRPNICHLVTQNYCLLVTVGFSWSNTLYFRYHTSTFKNTHMLVYSAGNHAETSPH
ncbi:hypothetical protein EXN66_Car004156 [Channa argus]|uniref:Uncharacterized protein n=1 Tax=Channa argus TaxID=215402 RepID=A0A6G1PEC8_CHAAH|nr:hypothetical protein EXN66_Car004156 [Channa argus]